MKTLYLLVSVLVLSAVMVVPCWSADSQKAGSQQVKKAAPQVPAVMPQRKTSPALKGETKVLRPAQTSSPGVMTSPGPARVDKGSAGPGKSGFSKPGRPVVAGKPSYN